MKHNNLYMMCKGTGADDYYKDMQAYAFSVDEIKAGHRILVDNDISPSPRTH